MQIYFDHGGLGKLCYQPGDCKKSLFFFNYPFCAFNPA
jgi:hypothetical protein